MPTARTRKPSRATKMAEALDHLEKAEAAFEHLEAAQATFAEIDARTFPRTGPVRAHFAKSKTSITDALRARRSLNTAITATAKALKADVPHAKAS